MCYPGPYPRLDVGKSRRQENLYFLELGIACCDSISSSCVMSKSDIWNFRLGHPSAVKIKLLHNELQIPSSLSTLSSHCGIYHLAKYRRLPFIFNNYMSANPFELVHIDVINIFSLLLMIVQEPQGCIFLLGIIYIYLLV